MINIEIPVYNDNVIFDPSKEQIILDTSNKYLKDNIIINAVTF
jgi:hypothetical protein